MARCAYCGQYIPDGSGIRSHFGKQLYCGKQCYVKSGQSSSDNKRLNKMAQRYASKTFVGFCYRIYVNFFINILLLGILAFLEGIIFVFVTNAVVRKFFIGFIICFDNFILSKDSNFLFWCGIAILLGGMAIIQSALFHFLKKSPWFIYITTTLGFFLVTSIVGLFLPF